MDLVNDWPANVARINVLLIHKEPKLHDIWLKNLNCLLSDQTKHTCTRRKHFCVRSMHTREHFLQRHIPECKGIGDRAVRIEMPVKGKNYYYKKAKHCLRVRVQSSDATVKHTRPRYTEDEMPPNTLSML